MEACLSLARGGVRWLGVDRRGGPGCLSLGSKEVPAIECRDGGWLGRDGRDADGEAMSLREPLSTNVILRDLMAELGVLA